MPLKGKKPEQIEKRLKMFVFGDTGVGKTTACIAFPNTYIIDLERGTENFGASIAKAGSHVMETSNPDEVKQELKTLLTEKHVFRTVAIDPITQLYHAVQEKWERLFIKYAETGSKNAELMDFGPRYWGRVKSEYKSVMRMLLQLDMNVVVTAHQKDIYGPGMQRQGVGPDSMKGDAYLFDFIFRLENPSGKTDGKRTAFTVKQRAEIGKPKFPEEFGWSYENFLKFYGKEIIERESNPVQLASLEQITEITNLIELIKVDEDTINAWFTKADVSEWSEMTAAQITRCLSFMRKKVENLKEVPK